MRVWAMTAQAACKAAAAEGDPSLDPASDEMKQMAALQKTAAAELDAMLPDAKVAFLAKMKKRVEVFQRLNPPDRLRYVQKLPEREKLDFIKSQILMMENMHKMQQSMQGMSTN